MAVSIPGHAGPEGHRAEPAVAWIVAPNAGPLTLDGSRSYAVGTSRVALLDPGPALEDQLERLRVLVAGRTVQMICLTHAHLDHSEMAQAAATAFDAPIGASPDTLRRCGLHGVELVDGASITLDGGEHSLTALAAPGHSADHLVYVLNPSRAVFTGDLVLGAGSSVVLHPDGDVGACLATFDRLLSLELGRLFPGHGPPVEDGAARIAEYREHRRARHAQVVSAVRAGGRTVADVRATVYGDLEAGLAPAADASIRAHLAWMRSSGEDLPPIGGFEYPPAEELER